MLCRKCWFGSAAWQLSTQYSLINIPLGLLDPRPILENKGMGCDFSEKEQSIVEEGKIFGSLGKNVQNLKTEKGQVVIIACNELLE